MMNKNIPNIKNLHDDLPISNIIQLQKSVIDRFLDSWLKVWTIAPQIKNVITTTIIDNLYQIKLWEKSITISPEDEAFQQQIEDFWFVNCEMFYHNWIIYTIQLNKLLWNQYELNIVPMFFWDMKFDAKNTAWLRPNEYKLQYDNKRNKVLLSKFKNWKSTDWTLMHVWSNHESFFAFIKSVTGNDFQLVKWSIKSDLDMSAILSLEKVPHNIRWLYSEILLSPSDEWSYSIKSNFVQLMNNKEILIWNVSKNTVVTFTEAELLKLQQPWTIITKKMWGKYIHIRHFRHGLRLWQLVIAISNDSWNVQRKDTEDTSRPTLEKEEISEINKTIFKEPVTINGKEVKGFYHNVHKIWTQQKSFKNLSLGTWQRVAGFWKKQLVLTYDGWIINQVVGFLNFEKNNWEYTIPEYRWFMLSKKPNWPYTFNIIDGMLQISVLVPLDSSYSSKVKE
jgi:hypothetical protein